MTSTTVVIISLRCIDSVFGAELEYHPAGCAAPLLRDINMELQQNSLGLVFGRSGSGKTTLLHVLAGLRQPTKGSLVRVDAAGALSLIPI